MCSSDLGTRYLSDLIKMFPGRLDLALASYNAGEGAVQRAGNKIPNYPETQNYVKTVTQMYMALKPPPPPQPLNMATVARVAIVATALARRPTPSGNAGISKVQRITASRSTA